jgi:hypothetical protein
MEFTFKNKIIINFLPNYASMGRNKPLNKGQILHRKGNNCCAGLIILVIIAILGYILWQMDLF